MKTKQRFKGLERPLLIGKFISKIYWWERNYGILEVDFWTKTGIESAEVLKGSNSFLNSNNTFFNIWTASKSVQNPIFRKQPKIIYGSHKLYM